MTLADLRQNYTRGELLEGTVEADPIAQFRNWFDEAGNSGIREPNAMTLATVDASGQPAARVVLLKGLDHRGFTFFTNYVSRKGHELAFQPKACLLFFWETLERQVRVEGEVVRIAPEESDAYFHSRPLGSRLGAWASPQSQVVPSREHLAEAEAQARARHGENPPRPPHWGGYRLEPRCVEFWQGRPSRLHDRLRYRLGDTGWTIERLAP